MRRIDRLLSRGGNPTNRAPSGAPSSTPACWFEITNLAEAGTAEIKLRGYIGMPTTERDWCTGEMVASGGAGTLQEFEAALEGLGSVKKIQLSIFSEGGDVFTGMAIHNLLVRHPAKKTCVIDGVCASAATYPALACGEIKIPSNAWMMIHGSSGICCGNADDMRSYAELLDSVNASIVNLYATRTGKTAVEIDAMLKAETWMDGAKAVEMGFADTVIEPLQNLAARAGTLQPTNRAIINHAPAAVLALFDMSGITNAPRAPLPTAMLKIQTPLMNAATDAPAASGAPAPAAAPAVAAAAPSPSPAPTPPPAASPAVPAVPGVATPQPAAAPVNTGVIALTQEQLQAMMTTAATNAVAAHVQNQAALAAHNVTQAALGGAAPVPSAVPAATGAPDAPVNTTGMSALQLINLGRKQIADAAKSAV